MINSSLLIRLIPIHTLNALFSNRLSFLALAGWFVRGKPLKTPKKPPAYATRRALTAGCSFCPFGGRNASAAAEQMRWSFLRVDTTLKILNSS
ncbi:MAG: hypothetical protein NTW61_02355 [Candidatus Melainabacteria bacterium]|nr:hypothetical protein [Candidatus Melainabacteria bacterium]